MIAFRNAFDRLFDSSISQEGWDSLNGQLPLDVTENEDEFVVKAVIPGINPDDLDISITNNMLTIRGETKAEEEKEGTYYHLRERRFGSFTRSISVPSSIKSEDVEASYDAGILTLRLPKTDEVKPKRIPVYSSSQKMIEGKVSDSGSRS